MRRFVGVAALAAVASLPGCETPSYGQQRSGRSPSGEYYERGTRLPSDNGPMRGDETYPSEYPNTGTQNVPPPSNPQAQGRTGAGASTPRPRTSPGTTGPGSTGTQGSPSPTGSDVETSPPSSDPSVNPYENPYGLGAGKNPKDAGMAGSHDGGMHLESVPPSSTY